MLEFQCRADEYFEARHAVLRSRSLEYLGSWIWGSSALSVGLVVMYLTPADSAGYLVAAVGTALLLNLTVWFRYRIRVEWRTTPTLAYRTSMEIRDTELRLRNVKEEIRIPWSTINRVLETSTSFVLCRSSDDVRIIPKRAFATKTQVAGFRTLLASAGRGDRSCAVGLAP